MELTKKKQILLINITEDLKRIEGVEAIVLGGSYAMGMATDSSDLDIGIYYSPDKPFDLKKIRLVAEKYSDNKQPTVTEFYEWGPWVNGGAWIKTKNGKVDFLYKNIDQVAATVANAKNGIWENNFEQQPPYGFSSIIFLAETYYCKPLYDPENIIYTLKQEVEKYPEKLRQTVIIQSLWSAEFTLWQTKNFALKGDVYNTLGCLTRVVKNIVTALFAINEIYPLGDKRALQIIEQAKTKPENLSKKINSILCVDENTLTENVQRLTQLFDEIVELAQDTYQPYYNL